MKKFSFFTLIICSIFCANSESQAQTCNYFAGTAVGGQSINVDLCSISRASASSVDFVYYLGKERVESQANCQNGTWITFPERALQRPQSSATQQMLNVVCSQRTSAQRELPKGSSAFVFDPPSNVRVAPNGEILCSIKVPSTIKTYGSVGAWIYTDACGGMGVIHSNQLRF